MFSLKVDDIFDELRAENNRLLNELTFSHKLYELFDKYRNCLINFNNVCICCENNENKNTLNVLEIELNSFNEEINRKNDVIFENDVQNRDQMVCESNENVINSENVLKSKLKSNNKCPENDCKQVFESCFQLKKHYISVHSIDGKIVCNFIGCGKEFKWVSGLKQHLMIHSSEDRPYKCDYNDCNYSCIKLTKFMAHINGHKGLRPFVCPLACGKAFKDKLCLISHLRGFHASERRFKCDYIGCDKCFKTKSVLDNHKHSHTNARPYACPHPGCSYRTKRSFNIKMHLNTHKTYSNFNDIIDECYYTTTNSSPTIGDTTVHTYKCPIVDCGQTFESNGAFRQHMGTHLNLVLACDWPGCEYKTLVEQRLKEHLKGHNDTDRTFVCDVPDCGKAFKLNKHLKQHKQIHSIDERYDCQWPGCQYRTFVKMSLTEHLKVHISVRKFICEWPECGKAFKMNKHLKQHSITHTNRRNFLCDWTGCQFRTNREVNLREHQKVHSNERNYVCEWPGCGKAFKAEPTRAKHHKRHISSDVEACHWPGCHFTTPCDRYLTKHIKKVHQK